MRLAIAFLVGCSSTAPVTKEQLGRRLFEDPRLSEPAGQACADCHDRRIAFADPEGDRTSAGVIRGRFGLRNAPTLLYASRVPARHRDGERTIGGLFWDGRVDTLAAQAAGPLLDPLEMNNASREQVAGKLRAHHAAAMKQVFGAAVFDSDDVAFERACEALAAFEASATFAPFSSKYDRYLAGMATLTAAEARGLAIFVDATRGNCAGCHVPPLFTDFSYANLGVPRFADNPYYTLPSELHATDLDRGLGRTTHDTRDDGRFRVPTLRNVLLTSPYAHNGYFRRLDEMIRFHAIASISPEVPATVDRRALAGFRATSDEIADLTAFLQTLTDARE